MSEQIKSKLVLDTKDFYTEMLKAEKVTEQMKKESEKLDKTLKTLKLNFQFIKDIINNVKKAFNNMNRAMKSISVATKTVSVGVRGLGTALKKVTYEAYNFIKANLSKTFNRLEIVLNRLSTISKRFMLAFVGLFAYLGKAVADVQDVENAFKVSFGESSNSIKKWSDVNAKEFRRSSIQMRKYLTGFKMIFKPYEDGIKLTSEQANEMSKELVKRALDMSSFFGGITDERAMNAFKSALIGNTKALRAMNTDLSESTVQNYLYSEGIQKSIKTMSFSEKVFYRYKALLKNTEYVMGDATKTSMDLENAGKAVADVWRMDVAAAFGAVAEPAISKVLNTLYDFGIYLKELPLQTKKNILLFMLMAAKISSLVIMFTLIVNTIALVARSFLLLTAPVLLVLKLFKLLGFGGSILTGALILVAGAIIKHFGGIDGIITPVYEATVKYFNILKSAYKEKGVTGVFVKIGTLLKVY